MSLSSPLLLLEGEARATFKNRSRIKSEGKLAKGRAFFVIVVSYSITSPEKKKSPPVLYIHFVMADKYASNSEVAELVANVNSAAKAFDIASASDVHNARRALQLEARKLLHSLEEPNQEVWPRIFQVRGAFSSLSFDYERHAI